MKKRRNRLQIDTILEIIEKQILEGKSNEEIYQFFLKDQPKLKPQTFWSWLSILKMRELENAKSRANDGLAVSVMKCIRRIDSIIKLCNEIMNDPDSSQMDKLSAAKLLKECSMDSVKIDAYVPTAVSRSNLMLYNETHTRRPILESPTSTGREAKTTQP